MANLLMHPRADSLTFLFTTQSGCEGVEMREEGEEEREEKKKEKQNAVFPSIILLYLAHTVVVLYKMPLTRVVGFASDS